MTCRWITTRLEQPAPSSGGAPALVAQVVGTAAARGVTLADVEIARPDLESVFLQLTQGSALGSRSASGKGEQEYVDGEDVR